MAQLATKTDALDTDPFYWGSRLRRVVEDGHSKLVEIPLTRDDGVVLPPGVLRNRSVRFSAKGDDPKTTGQLPVRIEEEYSPALRSE